MDYDELGATPELEDQYGPILDPGPDQRCAHFVAGRLLAGDDMRHIASALVRDWGFETDAMDYVRMVLREMFRAATS